MRQYLCPTGKSFFNYQKSGIDFLVRTKRCLLADEPGVGKTIQSIGAVNALPSVKRILVICPASAKLNWRNEFRAWSVRGDLTVGVADPKQWPVTDVVIVNYDLLPKWSEMIHGKTWDLLICDESSMVKDFNSGRAKQIMGFSTRRPILARRVWFLSGTPILNRPKEFWTTWRFLSPDTCPSYAQYTTDFCDGRMTERGYDDNGASNLSTLKQFIQPFMLRRTKAEVLPDLPPKIRQVIEIPAPEIDESKAEAAIETVTAIRRAMAKASDAATKKALLAKLLTAKQVAYEEIATLRKDIGVYKVPAVCEIADGILSQGQKLIIFGYHKSVIQEIARNLRKYSPLVITGETPSGQRQGIVDLFQKNELFPLFIGNIKAAGMAITLTAASTVIFAEETFVPAEISQAEDRAARIGQKNSVLVIHTALENSLDLRITKTLIRKQEVINQIFESGESFDLIDQLTENPPTERKKGFMDHMMERLVTAMEKIADALSRTIGHVDSIAAQVAENSMDASAPPVPAVPPVAPPAAAKKKDKKADAPATPAAPKKEDALAALQERVKRDGGKKDNALAILKKTTGADKLADAKVETYPALIAALGEDEAPTETAASNGF